MSVGVMTGFFGAGNSETTPTGFWGGPTTAGPGTPHAAVVPVAAPVESYVYYESRKRDLKI